MHAGLWWENLKESDRLEDLDVDRNNYKIDFKDSG
jgi:hypothetical protein